MAYDFQNNAPSSFQQKYANAPSDMEEQMQKEQLRAMLEQQLLQQRTALEGKQKEQEFQRQLQLLRQSSEYNQSDTRTRIGLEAQLYAMQKGYLPANQAEALINGQQASPQQMQMQGQPRQGTGEDEMIIDNMLGGGVGAYLGAKAVPKNINYKGLADILNKSPIASAGENLFAKGTYGMDNYSKANKASESMLKRILGKSAGGAAVGSAGLSSILGKTKGVEKGLGKVVGKIGGSALGKIGGAALGGPLGLAAGFVVPEILDAMITTDDEKRRKAQEEYMRGY